MYTHKSMKPSILKTYILSIINVYTIFILNTESYSSNIIIYSYMNINIRQIIPFCPFILYNHQYILHLYLPFFLNFIIFLSSQSISDFLPVVDYLYEIVRMFHQKEEAAEREKAHIFLQQFRDKIIDWEFSPIGSYDPIDLYFNSRVRYYSAEIKVRSHPLGKYPDYLLQEDKFEALKAEHLKGRTALYINFFSCGSFVVLI